MYGKAIIGAVPIGNDLDITYRLVRNIESAEIIFVETIEVFYSFIKRNSINIANAQIFKAETSHECADDMMSHIINGKTLLLLADEGTAAIADVGAALIMRLVEKDIDFDVMAGPSAMVPSYLYSGFFNNGCCFVYQGFLPGDKELRAQVIRDLSLQKNPIVIYQELKYIDEHILEFRDIFKENRKITMCMNITRDDQKIIRSSFDDFSNLNFASWPADICTIVIDCSMAGQD
jgi:16S rRNA (cytidine1402-2'-O)-methyltransferase